MAKAAPREVTKDKGRPQTEERLLRSSPCSPPASILPAAHLPTSSATLSVGLRYSRPSHTDYVHAIPGALDGCHWRRHGQALSRQCKRRPFRTALAQRIPYHKPRTPMIKPAQLPWRIPNHVPTRPAPIHTSVSAKAIARSTADSVKLCLTTI